MSEVVLKLESISKSFGKTKAVDSLTRVEQSAHEVAADLGFTLEVGKEITTEQKERLARKHDIYFR